MSKSKDWKKSKAITLSASSSLPMITNSFFWISLWSYARDLWGDRLRRGLSSTRRGCSLLSYRWLLHFWNWRVIKLCISISNLKIFCLRMMQVHTTRYVTSAARRFPTSRGYQAMKRVYLALSTTWRLRSSSTIKARKQELQLISGLWGSFCIKWSFGGIRFPKKMTNITSIVSWRLTTSMGKGIK